MKMLNVALLIFSFYLGLETGHSAAAKRQYQINNGPCSYTFLLPEQENCQTQSSNYNYPIQKDGPVDQDESAQRLEQLEITMENNTQWLLKVKLALQYFSFLRYLVQYEKLQKFFCHMT